MSDTDVVNDTDPCAVEVARLVELLATKVAGKKVSVRSLEKKMGVADSLFSKILKGKITLQVRHVLMICTALEIEWKDFFAGAYGLKSAQEAAPPVESAVADSLPALDQARIEETMIQLLLRLGVIDAAVAARLIREGLSRDRNAAAASAGAG